MSFTVSSLAAGFFFGVWGLYLIRRAKREAHPPSLVIGVLLIVSPYFVENAYLTWGIGAALLGAAYWFATR